MPDTELELFDKFAAIQGLNIAAALERIGGRRDVYLQTIKVLTYNIPGMLDRLQTLAAAADWSEFSIEAHGLKGSLRNVGALDAGETAYQLEKRGTAGDGDFCRETLPPLAETVRAMFDAIGKALAASEGEKTYAGAGDPAVFAKALNEARALLRDFESDDAARIIKELAGYDFGPERNQKLAELTSIVESFNYEKAIRLIGGLVPETP